MIIAPKTRGFICTTAHPVGCAKAVENQIQYVKNHPSFKGPRCALIIGASTGYGLASRIVSTFGADAKTIGVFFEKAADSGRTASPGWYNTAAFEKAAQTAGYYAKSINGDAFSDEVKQATINLIRRDLGQVDLIIYSLAAPRRIHPHNGENFTSVLKPIDQAYDSKTVDPLRKELKEIHLEPASEAEIESTIAVMGGEDWQMWLEQLAKTDCLAEGVTTIAYDYIGPELTHPIYKNGTIGHAKAHLYQTACHLDEMLQPYHGRALLSVNKALVTQASAAIPVVPLYISLLYKIMKEKGTHEGCIEQIYRLFTEKLYAHETSVDDNGRIRMDDLEMQVDVQKQISELWPQINIENLTKLTDIEGYNREFYNLFGFEIPGVNYQEEVSEKVNIPSLSGQ